MSPSYHAPSPVAVIDIGSNSVRLVVYDGITRSPMPLYNEKCLCGLAVGMASKNILNPDGVVSAKDSIARFMALADVMKINEVHLFATSAVRDASDGKQFVSDIEAAHSCKINILSGEEEALYAAYGIMSVFPHANGLAGDLGGGSLELVTLANDAIEKKKSYPIGPLRLADKMSTHEKEALITHALDDFDILTPMEGKNFYAIGGAFRNIAQIHMERIGYPLKVIQLYTLSAQELKETLDVIARMSPQAILKFSVTSKKRVSLLPFAAQLLRHIIMEGKPKNIVFSTAGVREGFMYSLLDNEAKKENPLLAGARDMARRISRNHEYGDDLFAWIRPLYQEMPKETHHLIHAACYLSEISWFENTEYRGFLAFEKILDSNLTGLMHTERMFIALSLYFRYEFQLDEAIESEMLPLLTSTMLHQAKQLGLAMRFARVLTGSVEGFLPKLRLELTSKRLTLHAPIEYKALVGKSSQKRFTQLAALYQRKPVVHYSAF